MERGFTQMLRICTDFFSQSKLCEIVIRVISGRIWIRLWGDSLPDHVGNREQPIQPAKIDQLEAEITSDGKPS